MKAKTWTTREGQVLRIKDMGTRHIENCIRMLERNAGLLKERQELFYVYMPGPSGDAATDAFDDEFGRLLEMPADKWIKTQPKYRALRKELDKRHSKETAA